MPSHIPDRGDELRRFKTELNLSRVAAAYGYAIDPKKTSRNSVSMVDASGDRIIIDKHGDTWMFWNPGTGAGGSVIDFVQGLRGGTLGQVRKELRGFLDGSTALPAPASGRYAVSVQPVPKDLQAVNRRWTAAERVSDRGGAHGYLNGERAIPAALLACDRFAGKVGSDRHGNAWFVHHNLDGVCGYEARGARFKGFAAGGRKGLWGSRKREDDRVLYVCETAIDCLSVAALFGHDHARFVSTAGTISDGQAALLFQAIHKLPIGTQVVLAVDHDAGGAALVERITPIVESVRATHGRRDLTLRVLKPDTPGTDFNDQLRAGSAGRRPSVEP